jgi:phosphate transport system protein
MFFVAQTMLQESLSAFEKGDREHVNTIFGMDEKLDKNNNNANNIIAALISEKPKEILTILEALTIMRKLERTGDHILNVAEELVFYFDAIVIKHSKLHKNQ